jgi:hypothetical protein
MGGVMIAQARSSHSPTPVLDGGLSAVRALGRMLMGAPPSPGMNWEAVWALVRGHGLSPLLYFRLFERSSIAAGGEEGARVPDEVAKLLRLGYHAMIARRMAAGQQLAGILKALAAVHVPGIARKGPVLGAFCPLPALRAYGDLDLLVREAYPDAAEKALNDLGYACTR